MDSHVSVKGRFLYLENRRFLIRGVVYQPWDRNLVSDGINDVLEDARAASVERDIALFKELNINTLFIYMFDPKKSHEIAMRLLREAGIYVFVVLSTPRICINRLDPYGSYRPALLSHYLKTIDCLSQYDNVIGVIAANSVINDPSHSNAAEIIRAVVRDLKGYMRAKARSSIQRILPVGLSNDLFPNNETTILRYFFAGKKEDRPDFWTTMDYSARALDDNRSSSVWDKSCDLFSEVPAPVFFSELGCGPKPRRFEEIPSLYSEKTTAVFSGACIYEFWQSANDWGLVKSTREGEIEKFEDFDNLRARLSEAEDLIAAAQKVTLPLEDDDRLVSFSEQTSTWKARPEIPEPVLDVDEAARGSMI